MNKETKYIKSAVSLSWGDLENIAKEVTKITLNQVIENPHTRPPYIEPYTVAAEIIADTVTEVLGHLLHKHEL